MQVTYEVVEAIQDVEEGGGVRSFGLVCRVPHEADGSGQRILHISTDEGFVARLARRFTQGQLDPLHFYDAVEDALAE